MRWKKAAACHFVPAVTQVQRVLVAVIGRLIGVAAAGRWRRHLRRVVGTVMMALKEWHMVVASEWGTTGRVALAEDRR